MKRFRFRYVSVQPDNFGDWPFWFLFLSMFVIAVLAGVAAYTFTAYVATWVAVVAYFPFPVAVVACVVALRLQLYLFSRIY